MNQVAAASQRPLDTFKHNLDLMNEMGELALPDTVPFNQFRNAAIVAIADNPSILSCKMDSVFKSLRTLAGMGLVPNGTEAAIVPFKGNAQAMPMVWGLVKIARNSGKIKQLWADVVYENEKMEMWVEGGERKWSHKTSDGSLLNPMARGGKVVGAYAVVQMNDGSCDFEPMGLEQIEKRRKASANQKGDAPTGIWQQWYGEMAEKTAILSLCKRLPLSPEDQTLIQQSGGASMRDVTPEEKPQTQSLATQLKGKPITDADPIEGEVLPPRHWTDDVDTTDAFPGSDEFTEGVKAFQQNKTRQSCPYTDHTVACHWLGGWDQAREGQSDVA